jgi:uncharacterized membrane protein
MNMRSLFAALMNSERQLAFAKTISWRVIATIVTGIIVYLFTGEIAESSKVTLSAAFVLTILYYFHEGDWDRFEKRFSRGGNV